MITAIVAAIACVAFLCAAWRAGVRILNLAESLESDR